MTYRIDGVPVTAADLLRLIEDDPCVLCGTEAPVGAAVAEPADEWVEQDWWVRFGPGRLQRAHTRVVVVLAICRDCHAAFGSDGLAGVLSTMM